MIKKILKTIIYALGIVLSLWILNTGLNAANYKYPAPKKTMSENVDHIINNDPTNDIYDYSFGTDYYTDVYNALYNINQNLGVLQQANDANTEKVLLAQQKNLKQTASLADDVKSASVAIQQLNMNRLGVVLIIVGAVVFLVYVEKIVNLYGFTIRHKKEKVEEQ